MFTNVLLSAILIVNVVSLVVLRADLMKIHRRLDRLPKRIVGTAGPVTYYSED